MNCPQCQCYCPPDSRECPCGYRFPAVIAAKPSLLDAPKALLRRLGDGAAGTKSGWYRLGLLAALALWAAALVFDDRLPGRAGILPPLYGEPIQSAQGVPGPFQVVVKKTAYTVKPLFRYEISGLVVSQHRSDSFLDLSHRRWRDYLNIKDLCLVWGRNISSGVYRETKFWNRDFTCMCQFPDEAAARRFSVRHLSNNHLLSADRGLNRRILRVRPGDQVRIRGYLAEYSQPANGFARGTSITRDDTGNGACETIFVTDFQVLRRANPGWRAAKPLALLAAGVFLALLLLA